MRFKSVKGAMTSRNTKLNFLIFYKFVYIQEYLLKVDRKLTTSAVREHSLWKGVDKLERLKLSCMEKQTKKMV